MTVPEPKDYLAAYIGVQRPTDAAILRMLKDAFKDVNAQLGRLQRERGAGAEIRRDQLRAIKRSILENQADVFRRLGKIIETRRVEAAARAIRVQGRYDERVFALGGRRADARALTEALETTETRAIDVAIARMTGSSVPLSQRVYRAEAWSSGRLERRIDSALARGLSAEEFAREVRDFVNPRTPGGTRYAALRLARTELNNAFHAIAIREAQRKPWIKAMKWHLSSSHPRRATAGDIEACEALAGRLFAPEDVPRKPHPQCLCYITPEVNAQGSDPEDDGQFLDDLVAGNFDDFLQDVIGRHNL